MPYSSSQISGMIGGQMAMFSNQAAYSQQIGGMVGTSPMGMAGGAMSNPFPQSNMGTNIAGGIGAAAGGAGTAMSIGGGLMGGAAGWLDPFTAAGRGMGMGTGASGFMGGLSNIGGAFAQGGLRAGMGMLGTGMAGAAAAALPATALAMGVSYAGGQIHQGAQNFQDVQNMSGHFGPQWGASGSSGGQMGNQNIKKITGALHELVGDDMRTTMEELKTVMDKAGQMGMLSGITDANAFKQKFGGIVKQVRQIADIMGTTLSEAAPMMGEMNKMGLWSSADVMGTAVAGKVAGPAAGQMMGAMSSGAQISHAMGGTMRAGAMMGREAFSDVQAAQRAGVISNRDVMEYTGGVGGAEGQRMMAGGMQRMMSKFSQSSAGQLMIAGLGARGETGEFTGEIDRGKLDEFLSGGVSVADLEKQGRKNLTRGNQASFFDAQEELGQNLGAEGGMGAMGKIVSQVLESKFGGESKLKPALMKNMFGMSNRDAKLAKLFIENQAKIRDQEERSAEEAINQAFENLERKQYRSWEGLKGAVAGSWREGVTRPLQEAGETLAADFGDVTDRVTGKITGKTRRISMGQAERGRLIKGGALTEDYSSILSEMSPMGQSFGQGAPMENFIRGIQNEGMGQMVAGASLAVATGGLSLGAAAYMTSTEGTPWGGMTQKQAALKRIGVDPGASDAQMRQGMARAFQRGESPLKLQVAKEKVEKVKSGMQRLIGQEYGELTKLREDDPKNYASAVLGKMGMKATPENLDAFAKAQAEAGYNDDLRADFKAASAEVGNIPTTPKELAEFQNEQLRNVSSDMNMGKAALGAGLAILTGGASLLWAASEYSEGLEREPEIQKAMTGKGGGVIQEYLDGTLTKSKALQQLSTMGDEGTAAMKLIDSGRADEKKASIQNFMAGRGLQAQQKALPKIRGIAVKGPSEVSLGKGGGGLQEEFKDIVGLYRGGDDLTLEGSEVEAAQEQALSLGQRLSKRQANRMRKGGGAIGRQIASISDVSRFKGGDEKSTAKLLSKLTGSGYDIESLAGDDERMKEILSDKVIDKDEAKEFGEKAADLIKKGLSETSEANKTHNQKMMELLNTTNDKSRQFVDAVDRSINIVPPADPPENDKPASPPKDPP